VKLRASGCLMTQSLLVQRLASASFMADEQADYSPNLSILVGEGNESKCDRRSSGERNV